MFKTLNAMVTQLKIILKLNSYLDYFANINVTQILTNPLVDGKITQKEMAAITLYLLFEAAIMRLKSNSYLMLIYYRDLLYLSTPTFFIII